MGATSEIVSKPPDPANASDKPARDPSLLLNSGSSRDDAKTANLGLRTSVPKTYKSGQKKERGWLAAPLFVQEEKLDPLLTPVRN